MPRARKLKAKTASPDRTAQRLLRRAALAVAFATAIAAPCKKEHQLLPPAPLSRRKERRCRGRQQRAKARCVGGGGERNRTDDLLLAKQALSQLSYTPQVCRAALAARRSWAAAAVAQQPREPRRARLNTRPRTPCRGTRCRRRRATPRSYLEPSSAPSRSRPQARG